MALLPVYILQELVALTLQIGNPVSSTRMHTKQQPGYEFAMTHISESAHQYFRQAVFRFL